VTPDVVKHLKDMPINRRKSGEAKKAKRTKMAKFKAFLLLLPFLTFLFLFGISILGFDLLKVTRNRLPSDKRLDSY